MLLIGRIYAHRIAYVDHVGADLIATDKKKALQFQLNQGYLKQTDPNNHLIGINNKN